MHRSLRITQDDLPTTEWGEGAFKFCEFSNFNIDGGSIDSDFRQCTFSRIEWYWGIFSLTSFVECRFHGCTFRGTAFAQCIFVECVFENCRFVQDNLGGACAFDGSRAYGCTASKCEGLPPFMTNHPPAPEA